MWTWVPALVVAWLVAPGLAAVQSPNSVGSADTEVIDIRGLWNNGGLNKKKAAARGLDSKVVKTPRKIRNAFPRYPPESRRAGRMGAVVLECRIDTDGVPQNCKVVEAVDPDLDAEALRCVEQWRFKPLTVRGEPKAALVDFTIIFRLN